MTAALEGGEWSAARPDEVKVHVLKVPENYSVLKQAKFLEVQM